MHLRRQKLTSTRQIKGEGCKDSPANCDYLKPLIANFHPEFPYRIRTSQSYWRQSKPKRATCLQETFVIWGRISTTRLRVSLSLYRANTSRNGFESLAKAW